MDNVVQTFVLTNGFRFVLIVVCAITTLIAIVRREELSGAALPAILGFGSIGSASAISAIMLYWELSMSSHLESLRSMGAAIGMASFASQALAVVGTVLIAVAVFGGRRAHAATPNNRWSGP